MQVLSPSQTHCRSVIILTMSRAGRPEHICWKRKKSFCYMVSLPKIVTWMRQERSKNASGRGDNWWGRNPGSRTRQIPGGRAGLGKQQSRERVEGNWESRFRAVGPWRGQGLREKSCPHWRQTECLVESINTMALLSPATFLPASSPL